MDFGAQVFSANAFASRESVRSIKLLCPRVGLLEAYKSTDSHPLK